MSERAPPPRPAPPSPSPPARLPGLLPPAGQAEAGRGRGLGLPGARSPGGRGAEARRAAGRGRRAPGAGGSARGGAGERPRAAGVGGRGAVGERGEGCAQGGPDVRVRLPGPAGRCVSEVRGEGRLGGNFRGELAASSALRGPGRSAPLETRSPPGSQGRPGGACGRGIADGSRDAWGPGLAGPSRTVHPGEVAAGLGPQFPGPVGGDGRPEWSHVPSARTPCARNPAAGGSLTLAAALYSGKCRGLPERPLRSQVAGGEASGEGEGAAAGRTDARCWAARPGLVPEPGWWEARVAGSGGARGCVGVPRALGRARGGKRSFQAEETT